MKLRWVEYEKEKETLGAPVQNLSHLTTSKKKVFLKRFGEGKKTIAPKQCDSMVN